MRLWNGLALATGLALAVLAGEGCQPAARHAKQARATKKPDVPPAVVKGDTEEPPSKPEDKVLTPDITWVEPVPGLREPPVPIVFVAEGSDRMEWNKLGQFWNVVELPPRPTQPVALIGGSPLTVAGLLASLPADRTVRVKVPLGLDDPTAYIPPANPPTLAKWELGKRLFFDTEHVLPSSAWFPGRMSCAGCHQPPTGWTHPGRVVPQVPPAQARKIPTLINSAYNSTQFWDGRAAALEEVVQRSLEDERDRADPRAEARHSWPGVVERLRQQPDYVAQFQKAFGTPPTQDAVGKALATYMRTILSGNSIHDRALAALKQRGGNTLEAQDYEKVLTGLNADELARLFDDEALKGAVDAKDPKAANEASQWLHRGWAAFHGKASCVQCHGGQTFSDGSFHNIGEGDSAHTPQPGKELGRFASLPPGLKDRRMIGAYRTPALRALPRTAPYGHQGLRPTLFDAVRAHIKPAGGADYLDPEIRDRGLDEGDLRALVLFLRALDGDAVPPEVAEPGPRKDPAK